MSEVDGGQIRKGMKLEVDGAPYLVVIADIVKPGKGQAFTRVRLKNMKTGAVVEKTYKSNDKLKEAAVEETKMRMLYRDSDSVVFMDDQTFEQIMIPLSMIGDKVVWLMEEILYDILFYNGEPVDFAPPTFMEMKIAETIPGDRGNTASGRVLKPATTETGAQVQVPIFIDQGEKIKIDTRTGEYVSRI